MEDTTLHSSTERRVTVKISGDGAKFSHSSSFVLLTFSFPELSNKALTGAGICTCNQWHKQQLLLLHAGNHTFAAIKGSESYELLSNGLKPVIDDINLAISNPHITIDHRKWTLDFVLGADMKVGSRSQ